MIPKKNIYIYSICFYAYLLSSKLKH
jgi:hypothetical protein